MNPVILETPERRWGCPSCGKIVATREAPDGVTHRCPVFGLDVPMTPVEQLADVHHVAVEREDYIAGEIVQLDVNGRPVMAIITEHADGSTDRAVYAPTATNRSS